MANHLKKNNRYASLLSEFLFLRPTWEEKTLTFTYAFVTCAPPLYVSQDLIQSLNVASKIVALYRMRKTWIIKATLHHILATYEEGS